MNSRVVLVTGATGFIGSRLTRRLLNEGYAVRAVTRDLGRAERLSNDKLSWIECDLSVRGLKADTFDGVTTIFHLAGSWRGTDTKELFTSNELVTINLLSSYPKNIQRILFASTQMVYGNPNSINVSENHKLDASYSDYSCSKVCAENWLKLFQRKKCGSYSILRFTGFVEGGGLVDYIIDRAIQGEEIELNAGGLVCRDYLPIENAIEALIAAEKRAVVVGYHVYNIGSGCAVLTNELALNICRAVNSKSKILLSKTPAIRSNFVFNISAARADLGFQPDDLIRAACDYAKQKLKQQGGIGESN